MLETSQRLDSRRDSRQLVLDSRFAQESLESSRESRLATDCQLTFERYCTHYFPQGHCRSWLRSCNGLFKSFTQCQRQIVDKKQTEKYLPLIRQQYKRTETNVSLNGMCLDNDFLQWHLCPQSRKAVRLLVLMRLCNSTDAL